MNNIIWRASGQADLMGEYSPQELRLIADEIERRQKPIDGTGWAEAAFEPVIVSNKYDREVFMYHAKRAQELFRWARREGGPIVDCQY